MPKSKKTAKRKINLTAVAPGELKNCPYCGNEFLATGENKTCNKLICKRAWKRDQKAIAEAKLSKPVIKIELDEDPHKIKMIPVQRSAKDAQNEVTEIHIMCQTCVLQKISITGKVRIPKGRVLWQWRGECSESGCDSKVPNSPELTPNMLAFVYHPEGKSPMHTDRELDTFKAAVKEKIIDRIPWEVK